MKGLKWNIAQYLELRWWKNYINNKDPEDYLNWKKSYWEKFIKHIPNFTFSKSTLELGGGPAGLYLIKNTVSKYTVVDPLLNSYENELSIFNKTKYPNIEFLNRTVEQLNLGKNYEQIVAINALNHFRNLEESVATIQSHLDPKGKVYVSIDCHNYFFLKKIFQAIPGDLLHPHQYSKKDYENLFLQRGFKILKRVKLKRDFVFEYLLYELELKD